MSKAVKAMVTAELSTRFDGLASACLIDLTGLDVQAQETLRKIVREKSGRLQVVKNSLARRAMVGGPLEPLGNVLDGPCAIITTAESLIDVAKGLVEAAKEFTELTLKEAILDGDPELLTVVQLAKMKSRVELFGEIAMLISSPGRALAGCLSSPQSKIVGCLKAIVEKAA